MSRLGHNQLDYLARRAGVFSAQIVPDALTRSLSRRGLLISLGEKSDGFLALTPAAYRAIADALEAGTVTRPPLTNWSKPS
jgi:hypothetical protein